MKRTIAFLLSLVLLLTCMPATAFADSATVVTIGADLSDAQKATMFKYFGVEENKVNVITVTNAEERQYLEGVATEAQIGRKTFSCAYIQETEEGNGINVKIANLNVVDSAMIATTLTTAGIYNCNVVAASPFEVSGTGALTGILKAFEKVTGKELDQEKKELATEELVTTTELAKELDSKDSATGLMTSIKDEVIKSGAKSDDEITDIIKKVAKAYGITLTDDQIKKLLDIMKKVSKQDYDYSKIKNTLQGISSKAADKLDIDLDINISAKEAKGFMAAVGNFFKAIGDFFKGIGNFFVKLFGGEPDTKNETDAKDDAKTDENKDLGILNNTNDSLLGDGAIINSTDESTVNSDTAVESKEETNKNTETNTQEPGQTDSTTSSLDSQNNASAAPSADANN